jgi:hypothetical protein
VNEGARDNLETGIDVAGAAAAAVPVVGGTINGILQTRTNRQLRHTDRELAREQAVLHQALAALNGRIDRLEALIGDPDFDDFLDDALTEAVRARTEDAQRLLGQIIAIGVTRGPDPAQIMLEAVSGLQAGHHEVLRELGRQRYAGGASYRWHPAAHQSRTRTSFSRYLPDEVFALIDPILAALQSRGLIQQFEAETNQRIRASGARVVPRQPGTRPELRLTPFGIQVVEFLHAPTPEEESALPSAELAPESEGDSVEQP